MRDRYVTLRTGMGVAVLDLAPTEQCESARIVATCADSTTAATVAVAMNTAHEHNIDELLDDLATLDRLLLDLEDSGRGDVDEARYDEALAGCRRREKERQ